jgi:UDP:flavonoid glycosyltransferase YjiC (YdhE family)
MKILVASTPAEGHLNPLLGITRILLGEGHEIAFLTGSAFGHRIESSGIEFISLRRCRF